MKTDPNKQILRNLSLAQGIASIVITLGAFFVSFEGNRYIFPSSVIIFSTSFLGYILIRKNFFLQGGYIFLLGTCAGVAYIIYARGFEDAFTFFYIWPIVAGAMIFGAKGAWVIGGFSAFGYLFVATLQLIERQQPLIAPSFTGDSPVITIPLTLTVFFLITFVVAVSNQNLNKALDRAQSSERAYSESNTKLKRRAVYLKAAADVGRAAAEVYSLDKLFPFVASLISERYGFYHVGVFLLDENKEYAVLRAANSEGGQEMLENNHRLKVGEQGIVGYVTSTNQPRIALDVGEDAVYFNNPYLPETRSEMALPLVFRGVMLGALDVQSKEAMAFTEEDITSLQLLADQVALAINNAHLFEQMQIVLLELEKRVTERTSELRERNLQLENAYNTLRENQQRLLIAEKMASLGRLTAGIAHEMNTPLAAVRASLHEMNNLIVEYRASIEDSVVTPQDHREIIAEMQEAYYIANNSAERAAGFVRSIKSQSRNLVPEDKHDFNVVSVIQESLLLLKHLLREKNCQANFEYSTEDIVLLGSPGQLIQIITNLVTNSIDATSGTPMPVIDIHLTSNVNDVQLLVKDNGCGIPEENISKIFDPMFTTKPFGEGTGLGLTIVHDIVVSEFGGTIEVQSEVNEGTTFLLKLPEMEVKENDT